MSSLLSQLTLLPLVLPIVEAALLFSLPSLLVEQTLLLLGSALLFGDASLFGLAFLIKSTAVLFLLPALLGIATLFGLALLIKSATIFFLLPSLQIGVAAFFSLTPLLVFILTLLIKPATLFLLLALTLGLALLILGLSSLLFLRLPFIGAALLISLPPLLLLGLSFVILSLALSLVGPRLLLGLLLGFLLVVPLLSFLSRPALPVRAVFRLLRVPELDWRKTICPKTTCTRQGQDRKHKQYRQAMSVICFHDCLLVGERS